MQETTECETIYELPSDELIEKLGIDTKYKIEDIETHFHMGGMHYSGHTDIEIKLQPIVSINENSTTTCRKSFTLDEKELMEKLGLKGNFRYTEVSNSTRHHKVSIRYQLKTVD